MPGITVGVDGSERSRQALEWAVREAGLRGAALTVLAVHEVASNHWTGSPELYPADQPVTEAIRRAAEDAVQKAVSQAGEPGPASVTVRAVSGLPAQELVGASSDGNPSRVVPLPPTVSAAGGNSLSGTCRVEPRLRITARPIMFCSSRMLPGQ